MKKLINSILSQYENGLLSQKETIEKLYAFWPNVYLTEELISNWPELQEGMELYTNGLCSEL